VPPRDHSSLIRRDRKIDRIKEREDDFHLGQLTCIATGIADPTTAGMEDPELPPMGEAFFYLVEYFDGVWSSYGSVDAAKQRFAPPGQGGCH
jgi:hypothetical protein